MKTPEQRAAKIVECGVSTGPAHYVALIDHRGDLLFTDASCVSETNAEVVRANAIDAIARAIRAAENAALEHAAHALERCYPSLHVVTGNRVQGPAGMIRGLKTRAARAPRGRA